MDFTKSVKNAREEVFWENSKFEVLMHGFGRETP